MARETKTTVTCDSCHDLGSWALVISDTDPEEGGPVINVDLCTACVKKALSGLQIDKTLIHHMMLK